LLTVFQPASQSFGLGVTTLLGSCPSSAYYGRFKRYFHYAGTARKQGKSAQEIPVTLSSTVVSAKQEKSKNKP